MRDAFELERGTEIHRMIAVKQILSHRVPARKEASVGADVLLIISGDGLFPPRRRAEFPFR